MILNELSIKFIYIFALVAGTLGGLIVKYLLDKYFIFNSASTSLEKEFKKFSIYTVLGASTTLIFWFTETTFYLIYKTHFAREIGALIGLTVGYFIKYNLIESLYLIIDYENIKWLGRFPKFMQMRYFLIT